MEIKTELMFASGVGKRIYENAKRTIRAFGMAEKLSSGTLVGFSGGADSVMLLLLLSHYAREYGGFKICALHVNHLIRGEEAERDERFAREFCSELGVEFISVRKDVPSIAKSRNMGLEECAREVRYSEFSRIISGRKDLSVVAVAHNADDNLETMLLNLLRGGGSRGLSGIPPARENILRPLILSKKEDIVQSLAEANVPFVTDSSNFSDDYKRNYIRNRILPSFRAICDSPEKMAARACANLRVDDDYITGVAEDFLKSKDVIFAKDVLELHFAVQVRVIAAMAGDLSLSTRNFEEIRALLPKTNFSYSLPGAKTLVCERGVLKVMEEGQNLPVEYNFPIKVGETVLSDFDSAILVSEKKEDKFSSNVYKISIQTTLSSAIIEGGLYIRPKRDGDSVFYGGMTHKLKKLYSDRKIPLSLRSKIPLLCDAKGILWVPGFGVRDDGVRCVDNITLFVTLGIGTNDTFSDTRFYSASEFPAK